MSASCTLAALYMKHRLKGIQLSGHDKRVAGPALVIGVVALGIGAVSAQLELKDALRPVVRLKGGGAETVINCPWDKKLSIKISRESAAAVMKCIDGGPGVELDFRNLSAEGESSLRRS
jgi:hypothetical protein